MHFDYSKQTKRSTSKVHRFSTISSQENRVDKPRNIRIKNKEGKMLKENRLFKEYFKTSYNFFNEKEYNDNFSENNNSSESINNYNKESNRSYIKIEDENGYNKYIPRETNDKYVYNDFKNISSKLKSPKYNSNYITIKNNNKNNEYYDDNSLYSENNYNNYNFSECNESENTNDNKIIIQKFPTFKLNKFRGNINIYSSPISDQNKKKRKNFIKKVINTDSNFSKDKRIKVRTIKKNIQNFGNRTTTTNNTYNNNIYYINPINVKNKLKEKFNPVNINRCFDNSLHQKTKSNYREYCQINNVYSEKYINAVTLIQSMFRGYLTKSKICNYINLCIFCDRGVEIIVLLFLNRKKLYFNIFKNNIESKISFNNSLKTSFFFNHLKSKMKDNDVEKKKLINSYNRNNKDNKLQHKLSDIINENSQLKIQLFDLKSNEESLKELIKENKKLKYINELILKDNQELNKKLKEFQKYRNNKLFIQKQSQFYISKNPESNKKNENYLYKLKKFMADKLVYKKYNNNNLAEDKINKQRGNNKIKVNNLKRNIYLKNLIKIIEKSFQSKVNKYFWDLYKYYKTVKEEEIKKLLLKNKLKKIIFKKEQENIKILRKIFFKFMVNNIKYDKEHLKKIEKEDKKVFKLKKIFKKYEKNVEMISKVVLKQWNLKSKIMGMRAAAKDKKKKRKEKKKINKFYSKYFDTYEKNNSSNNLDSKLSERINFFRTITSNEANGKESFYNKFANLITRNSFNKKYNTINEIKDENNEEVKIRNMHRRYFNDNDRNNI